MACKKKGKMRKSKKGRGCCVNKRTGRAVKSRGRIGKRVCRKK